MSSPCEPSEAANLSALEIVPVEPAQQSRESARSYSRLALDWLGSLQGRCALAWVLTLAFIVADIAVVGGHALTRYETFRSDAFDLGNMSQAVWNTIHGHAFRFTNRGLDWFGPPTRLGVHVEPILLLISVFYLIHAEASTLIILQSIALALGALPLFLLALRRLPGHPLLAMSFAAAYLASALLLGEALWDFHPVALATPLILTALWALDTRRTVVFVLCAVLAALTKEDVALSLALLGLLLMRRRDRRVLGVATLVLSLAWVALCFGVILPHYNQGVSGGNNFWYRYSWLGDSASNALSNILHDPALPFTVFLDPARRGYLTLLALTGGGVALLSPLLLVCSLPDLAVNLLSVHSEQYSGFFQYNSVIIPYIFVGSVIGAQSWLAARARAEGGVSTACSSQEATVPAPGWRIARWPVWRLLASVPCRWERVLERIPVPSRWIGPLIAAWLIVTSIWNIAAIQSHLQPFWDAGSTPYPYQSQVEDLLNEIPTSASVAATDTLDPYLSNRYDLYLMPDAQSYQAEYVAVDLYNSITDSQAPDAEMYESMLDSHRYVIVGSVDTVTLLRRIGKPIVSSDIVARSQYVRGAGTRS